MWVVGSGAVLFYHKEVRFNAQVITPQEVVVFNKTVNGGQSLRQFVYNGRTWTSSLVTKSTMVTDLLFTLIFISKFDSFHGCYQ